MKNLIVRENITIQKALKIMSKVGEKCLIVTDEDKKIFGTLSDGDLRKAILNGSTMTDPVSTIYNSNATFFRSGKFSTQEARKVFIKNRFEIIPVVDDGQRVVDILYWDKVFERDKYFKTFKIDASVVIMAGGKGTRLEPFTSVLPKPLVPIKGKPIIEHIIDRFTAVGASDFHLTVNYKSRIMKAFFEELQPTYSIRFVEETEPLGTAGSLKFLSGTIGKPFFVTNCDILVDADYVDLYDFHTNNDYAITLVASMKNYTIPYGICKLNGNGSLDHIHEKPEYNFLVNSGLYVLNPDVLALIPKDKLYHITELVDDAIHIGMKVGVYPINDDAWMDVGQWAEYRKTVERFGI